MVPFLHRSETAQIGQAYINSMHSFRISLAWGFLQSHHCNEGPTSGCYHSIGLAYLNRAVGKNIVLVGFWL